MTSTTHGSGSDSREGPKKSAATRGPGRGGEEDRHLELVELCLRGLGRPEVGLEERRTGQCRLPPRVLRLRLRLVVAGHAAAALRLRSIEGTLFYVWWLVRCHMGRTGIESPNGPHNSDRAVRINPMHGTVLNVKSVDD